MEMEKEGNVVHAFSITSTKNRFFAREIERSGSPAARKKWVVVFTDLVPRSAWGAPSRTDLALQGSHLWN
jgi:hypothetical protein